MHPLLIIGVAAFATYSILSGVKEPNNESEHGSENERDRVGGDRGGESLSRDSKHDRRSGSVNPADTTDPFYWKGRYDELATNRTPVSNLGAGQSGNDFRGESDSPSEADSPSQRVNEPGSESDVELDNEPDDDSGGEPKPSEDTK